MLKLFLLQIFVLFLIFIALDWLRLLINRSVKKEFKLRLIDAVPVCALYFIHQLTMDQDGFSWDAILIMVWMLIGLLILIHKTFFRHRLSHKNFYKTLWRVGDLYLLVAWILIGFINVI